MRINWCGSSCPTKAAELGLCYTIASMKKYQPITTNRRAKYDFAITDSLLAGIVLLGTEVKSIRNGRADLKGAFATLKNDELWLNNAFVPPYQTGRNLEGYDPSRARKLLVHKRELKKLTAAQQSGLSIVPLSLGAQGGFLKTEVGIGKGKRKQDKRETIKRRAAEREASRHIKRSRK